MKKLLLLLMLIVLGNVTFSQSWTRAQDTQKYFTSGMHIVGVIKDITYQKAEKGYLIFMKLDAISFNHNLTLVLRSSRLPQIPAIKSVYLEQYVHVTGRIDLYKGKSSVNIYNASQLSLAKEVPADDDAVWPR